MEQEELLLFEDTSGPAAGKKRGRFSPPKWTKFVLIVFLCVGTAWVISAVFFNRKEARTVDTSAMRPAVVSELGAVGAEATEEYSRKMETYAKAKADDAAESGRTYVAPVTPAGRPVLEVNKQKTEIAAAPEGARQTEPVPPHAKEARVTRQPTQKGDQRMMAFLAQISSQLAGGQKSATVVLNKPAPHIVTKTTTAGKTTETDLTIPPGVKAGDILYSINRITLDSDAPGPAMVEVVDGPYAGGKAIGQFSRGNEHLTLEFSSLTMPDGTRYTIKGYAIDPRTDRTAVRSDVDTHAFERWTKFVAAKFLEGFGSAVGASGTSSYSSLYGGGYSIPNYNLRDEIWIAAGKVGEGAARIVERDFDKPPTVTLDSGTEIGILIISVGKAENTQSARTVIQSQQQTAQQRNNGF